MTESAGVHVRTNVSQVRLLAARVPSAPRQPTARGYRIGPPAHLFSAEITNDELARLRATWSVTQGGTERTRMEITTFGEICSNRLVDWTTLGMIAEAMLDVGASPPA